MARASATMGLERPYLGLGVERRKAEESLSLSFQLVTSTPLWSGCREMALTMTSSVSFSLALTRSFLVALVVLPHPGHWHREGPLLELPAHVVHALPCLQYRFLPYSHQLASSLPVLVLASTSNS